MFNCVICGKQVTETERIYENLDWCKDCIRKDGDIVATECKVGKVSHPIFGEAQGYSRPPYYATYRNKVPKRIKEKIKNWTLK